MNINICFNFIWRGPKTGPVVPAQCSAIGPLACNRSFYIFSVVQMLFKNVPSSLMTCLLKIARQPRLPCPKMSVRSPNKLNLKFSLALARVILANSLRVAEWRWNSPTINGRSSRAGHDQRVIGITSYQVRAVLPFLHFLKEVLRPVFHFILLAPGMMSRPVIINEK